MFSTAATLAAESTTGIPPIICTILLIATVIAFILGLAEALGFFSVRGTVTGNGRFGTLVVAVVLLVVYVIVC